MRKKAQKKLQGVMAVQALSRLNRSAPHLGKKTEDLFILDFFNRVEEIQTAFDDFHTAHKFTTVPGVQKKCTGKIGDFNVRFERIK